MRKAIYLSRINFVQDFAKGINIDVINNTEPYDRARNDPHANAVGNDKMANDIYKYLMDKRGREIERLSAVPKP